MTSGNRESTPLLKTEHGHHSHEHEHAHEHNRYNGHDHDHDHNHSKKKNNGNNQSLTKAEKRKSRNAAAYKKLRTACLCSVIFMIAEVIGGYLSGSLAIMADAAHLCTDVASLLLSIFSIWVAETYESGSKLSYGCARAEVIGAVMSVLLIWVLTGWILAAAIHRLSIVVDLMSQPDVEFIVNPDGTVGTDGYELVNGKIMFVIACMGLIVNLTLMQILGHHHDHGGPMGHSGHDHGHHHHIQNDDHDDEENHDEHYDDHNHDHDAERQAASNINVHAAYIHAVSDLLQSIGVCIAGGLIWYNPRWQLADPIATFMFSALVLASTFGVISKSLHVLMEGTPEDINHDEIEEGLEALPSVDGVHDLHIWSLTIGIPALSVHVVSENPNQALKEVQEYLLKKGVDRTTIQVESSHVEYPINCAEPDL